MTKEMKWAMAAGAALLLVLAYLEAQRAAQAAASVAQSASMYIGSAN